LPASFCFFPSVSASLSFSKISPPVRSSLSQKIIPPLLWFCSLPCIYKQPGERFTIPCTSTGHWWSGHGSSDFRHGGGHESPVSPLMRVWVV
jgi:hypothetical protein